MTNGDAQAAGRKFVYVKGTHLMLGGHRYYFLGTNFWYGMNLGAPGALGNRARLVRELDRLKTLGVTNLRILAGSEGPDSEPWRIAPALQTSPGQYRKELVEGLQFLLYEMGKRGMYAVVCLNNFWPWSGGMAQYLSWANGGSIPYPPPAAGGTWGRFMSYTAGFYSNEKAMRNFDDFLRFIVRKFNNEPAIMSWELANEPRGSGNVEAFNRWIEHTADLIKSLDSNHLVTTGSEGETTSPTGAGNDFVRNHRYKSIDYATIHIWAQNWGWFDPENPDMTYDRAVENMRDYLSDHVEKARRLGKPLVVEEFGIARDNGSYDPMSPATVRNRYYADVFRAVYDSARSDSPVAGVNFWAWAGEATPRKPGGYWRAGDPFVGDPPHESQGWYSVYAGDSSTLKVILDYTALLGKLSR